MTQVLCIDKNFIPIVCERKFLISWNKYVFFSAAEILFHCFFGIVAVVFPPKPATGAAATAAAAVGTAALGTGGGGGGGNASSRPSDDGKAKNSKTRWLNFNSLETSGGGKTLHCRTHCEVRNEFIDLLFQKNSPALKGYNFVVRVTFHVVGCVSVASAEPRGFRRG